MMAKHLFILFFFIGCYSAGSSQLVPGTAGDVVAHYSPAQKRLLVFSAVHTINLIAQYNQDQDSITAIACRISGLPFLIPYTECLDDRPSPGADLINAGRIAQARELAQTLHGEDQIRLLLELSIRYLYQPGTHLEDLDSAGYYLRMASQLSGAGGQNAHWQNTCALIQAELYYQGGSPEEGRKILLRLCTAADQGADIRTMAMAYRQLGSHMPFNDSTQTRCYNTSLELFKRSGNKEGEIDLLWRLATIKCRFDLALAKEYILRVEDLQRSIGFRHTLYCQYLLSYVHIADHDFLMGLEVARAGMENMQWSGITAVQGIFYMRMGMAYGTFNKQEESWAWYRKAIDSGTRETHLFWYKSLLYLTTWMADEYDAGKALDLIQRVTAQHPPLTVWEQMQVLSTEGLCYNKLGNYPQADKHYMAFLDLSDKFPNADPMGELLDTYIETAQFYLSHHQGKKSQLIMNKAFSYRQLNVGRLIGALAMFYEWYYKIDSINGRYKSALKNHILYKQYHDSSLSLDQVRKFNELTLKYSTEKKDQDIQLLKQQSLVQQTQLHQQKLVRNITFGGIAGLLFMTALLFIQYRSKKRINKEIVKKNETLNRLVDEKEWLLKEVHHRVKNNLQTIVSLLELQPDASPHDFPAIRDSRSRIYAMSLIHQKLYQTDNIAAVNMELYIRELVSHLQDAYDASRKIRFRLDIDPASLDVSQAVPTGLIVNEAVTNSIKYAFDEGGDHPTITVSLKAGRPGRMELTIADNGKGLNVGNSRHLTAESDGHLAADNGNTGEGGLGFRLMRGLAEDIDGEFLASSARGGGAQISIKFPVSAPFNDISIASSTQKTVNV